MGEQRRRGWGLKEKEKEEEGETRWGEKVKNEKEEGERRNSSIVREGPVSSWLQLYSQLVTGEP